MDFTIEEGKSSALLCPHTPAAFERLKHWAPLEYGFPYHASQLPALVWNLMFQGFHIQDLRNDHND